MKIAVNTRLLIKDKLEGIGWFTYHTLSRMVKDHPEHEFFFFFDRPYDQEFVFASNVTPIVVKPQARHPILFNIWFDRSVTKKLKKIGADVFLSPDGFLSLKTDVPQIAVFHDINFEHYPEDLPRHITKWYKKRFPLFAEKANHIITVSEFSKQDIIDHYKINQAKISVVYNAVNEEFKPLTADDQLEVRNKYSNGFEYFVYVGSIHARKNVARMLIAFDQYKTRSKSDMKFLVVGNALWKDELPTIEKLAHHKDIIFTGRIAQSELPKVIASSNGLIYTSYFEGFGIPVLEGMACGVPVLTSNVTSMPEVAGGAAELVDPFQIESIAKGMENISEEGRKNELVKKGLDRAATFSWDKSAKNLWSKIEEVIS